jgi:hypothetical protein
VDIRERGGERELFRKDVTQNEDHERKFQFPLHVLYQFVYHMTVMFVTNFT